MYVFFKAAKKKRVYLIHEASLWKERKKLARKSSGFARISQADKSGGGGGGGAPLQFPPRTPMYI